VSTTPGAPADDGGPVGAVLLRMRRAKGLTGAELAGLVGMSQPKISRIERGQGLPDPRDVGIIAQALGADDEQIQALMERAEGPHDRMTDWRPVSSARVAQQRTLADWEAAATVVRSFEPALVPGSLQTSGYARAVFESFRSIPFVGDDLTESAVVAAVSARVRRQEALADRSKSFQFLLGEAALKRRACSPVEMLAQISHLRDTAARNANVKIAVILDGAPVPLPLQHGFTLIDDKLVVVDLYNTGLSSRSRRDVESYRRVLDILEESATDIGPVLDGYQDLYIDMLQKTRK
jgi:transcriptional regulator with XRE-family HTH domain